MIRSGKKLRHKDTSANNNVDKISNLPDSLLIDILSLLSPSDVKQTRILSKRWKNLFAFLPNLCFHLKDPSQVRNFHVFVDQTLAIRGDMLIEKLLLKADLQKVGLNCQYDLLRTFVRFNFPQELELRGPMFVNTKFCWDLVKTWDTLVGLTLEGRFMPNVHVPSDKLIFPCLKKLSLLPVSCLSCELLANLFNGCPVLEELSVEGRGLLYNSIDVAVIKVSLLSLKRLRISLSSFYTNWSIKFMIDAPKLEYIYINETIDCCLTKPLSLVEADICHSSKYISELVPFLVSAKILRLNVHSQLVSYRVHGINMHVFPNLVRLVIGVGLDFLPVCLNNMPNIEHITLSYRDRIFSREQDLPVEPPVCLRFKLKEIVVHKDTYLTQEEFTFMRYLLEHSIILEKLRFSARSIDPERREQLLNFHRGSERCQIEFV